MALVREKMMELIKKKIPAIYLKTTEEFYSHSEGTGIWCCSVEDRLIWKKKLIQTLPSYRVESDNVSP
jgi:hypothetical protein